MTKEKRTKLYNWFIGVGTAVLTIILGLGVNTLVKIRDYVEYEQEQVDNLQDLNINNIQDEVKDLNKFKKTQLESTTKFEVRELNKFKDSQTHTNKEILRKITEVSSDIKSLKEKQDLIIELIDKSDFYTYKYNKNE